MPFMHQGYSSFLGGYFVMSDKTFKTYAQQMQILVDRGLIINHPRTFTTAMQQDDYYNIINGYKKYFIATMSPEQYIKGTTFEHIYALYNFDQKLREILLPAIIRIEKHVKSVLAYVFSKAYGHDHRTFLVSTNFDNVTPKKILFSQKLINNIYNTINYYQRNGHPSICHYQNNYGYIPLWVLNTVLTFGNISKFYACLKLKEQKEIADHFHISASDMRGFMPFLNEIRNICAHGERIYTNSREGNFTKFIPDTPMHAQLNIPKNSTNNYNYGKSDVLAMIIAMKIFLPKSAFRSLKSKIIRLEKHLSLAVPSGIMANIDKEMGDLSNNLRQL